MILLSLADNLSIWGVEWRSLIVNLRLSFHTCIAWHHKVKDTMKFSLFLCLLFLQKFLHLKGKLLLPLFFSLLIVVLVALFQIRDLVSPLESSYIYLWYVFWTFWRNRLLHFVVILQKVIVWRFCQQIWVSITLHLIHIDKAAVLTAFEQNFSLLLWSHNRVLVRRQVTVFFVIKLVEELCLSWLWAALTFLW